MQIKQNPFVSDVFSSKWLIKFNSDKPAFTFNFIGGLRFYKPSFLPIYINAGQNLTKGISYFLKKVEIGNFKNSVILIYDVPDYFDIKISNIPDQIKSYKIKQYPGYLTNLKEFKNLNDFLQNTFSRKTRSNFRRYEKRLKFCFDVKYIMYYGEISRKDYDFIFEAFRTLLEKRFDEKKIVNNNLDHDEWAFYYDVAFSMILEKKASLFVVYEGLNPIAITLNYLSEDILFYGITVFDTDYSKFRIGKIALLNLFAWCFENNIGIFDFSKGDFDYKTHWMTKSYDFEYHIYFDRNSLKSKITAFIIKSFFKLKQFLREKDVHIIFHKMTHWFKYKDRKFKSNSKISSSETLKDYKESELLKINLMSDDFSVLKSRVIEFLFLNNERLKDLNIFKLKENTSTYLIKGKNISKTIITNNN